MAWHVDSNVEYRTHPQNLERSRWITKSFPIRSNSWRKRSLLLTPQKSTQNIWHQTHLVEEPSLCHVPFNHDKILSNCRKSLHYCVVNFLCGFFSSKHFLNKALWNWCLCVKLFSQNSYKCFVTNKYVQIVQIVLVIVHYLELMSHKLSVTIVLTFFSIFSIIPFFPWKKEIHCSFLCIFILVGGWEKL